MGGWLDDGWWWGGWGGRKDELKGREDNWSKATSRHPDFWVVRRIEAPCWGIFWVTGGGAVGSFVAWTEMGHEEDRGPLLEGLRNVACKTHTHTHESSLEFSLSHSHRVSCSGHLVSHSRVHMWQL